MGASFLTSVRPILPLRHPIYFALPRGRGTRLLRHPVRQRARHLSTLPRPYTFHIGLAYARKPPDTSTTSDGSEEPPLPPPSSTFPPLSPKGVWRDRILTEWAEGDVGREPIPGAAGAGLGVVVGDRAHAMGEDFLFVQKMRGNSGVALGIADGVGGWSASGVDPSLFSQCMMFHSSAIASTGWACEPDVEPSHAEEDVEPSKPEEEVLFRGDGWEARGKPTQAEGETSGEMTEGDGEKEVKPKEILQKGYDAVVADPDVEMGASTACILTLNSKTGLLRAANLGDSGFVLIRGGAVRHFQPAQTHYFNCPKQLSKYPRQAFRRSNRPQLDMPSVADEWECTLRHGDVILLFTDGLSDNIFPSQMADLAILSQAHVSRSPASSSSSSSTPPLSPSSSPSMSSASSAPSSPRPTNPLDPTPLPRPEPSEPAETTQAKRLARMCVEHARKAMVDVTALTPFEVAAKTQGGWEWWDWIGGKIDDVTVIAVVVTEGM